MKNLIFIAVLFCAFSLKAQTYLPFPDSNAIWVNTYYNVVPIGPTYQNVLADVTNYCTDGDTIIGAQTYTRIEKCPENEYHAAIRDDNGKVYVVPKDSSTEYILYDFTVSVGDTIHNLYYEYFGGQGIIIEEYIVYSVQTVNLDGIDRIVIDDMWYEGIGNRQGLFLEPWINISMYTVKLECHSVNGLGVYPNASTEPCPMNLSLINNSISIGIYPNPVSELLNVESRESIDSYQIFDCVGKIIQPTKTFSSTIDVSNLLPGLYQIEFSYSTGKIARPFYKN